jgi:hypothetical protein
MKFSRLVGALFSLGLAAHSFAGSAITSVIVVPFESPQATAIALVQSADYLCAHVDISSREKDSLRQIEDVRAAMHNLEAAAEKSPCVQLHRGPLRFFQYGATGGKSFGVFSGSHDGGAHLSSGARLLYKLDGSENDALTGTAALRRVVENLKIASQVEVRIRSVSLAVDSPERQRERLLALIRESADAMRKTFAADAVTVGGLDGPVLVRQVDASTVELFIDYQLSVTAGK